MSELIDNSKFRKKKLKDLILQLHQGESVEKVRKGLIETLQNIPYCEVVEVEQELIMEGLSEDEVLKLCDGHGQVLEGNVDLSAAKKIPEGHPVDVFKKENLELLKVTSQTNDMLKVIDKLTGEEFNKYILSLQACFNELMDIDKHYQRKEYLVFPYLEKNEITGPPKVMWGKHNEIREQLKGCIEVLKTPDITSEDLKDTLDLLFKPVLQTLIDMVIKEEEILFPMCMDILTTEDWWNVHKQTLEIGFALYDPKVEWHPEGLDDKEITKAFSTSEGTKFKLTCPDWFNESKIDDSIDIRDVLHEGERPVHEVLSAIKELENDKILKVIAPFIPAPLIDKSLSLNIKHWLNMISEDKYEIFFKK